MNKSYIQLRNKKSINIPFNYYIITSKLKASAKDKKISSHYYIYIVLQYH